MQEKTCDAKHGHECAVELEKIVGRNPGHPENENGVCPAMLQDAGYESMLPAAMIGTAYSHMDMKIPTTKNALITGITHTVKDTTILFRDGILPNI